MDTLATEGDEQKWWIFNSNILNLISKFSNFAISLLKDTSVDRRLVASLDFPNFDISYRLRKH